MRQFSWLLRLPAFVCVVLMALWPGCTAAAAEKRVALVIGNSAYAHTTPLTNPLNDARDMVAALKRTGFDVVEALDADKLKLDGALRSFTDKLTNADVALFFYAGHGLQVGAQNYLVPVDAKLDRERDLEFEAVKLDFVLRQMEIDREGKTTIVILDACRDNPLSRNLARSMGTRSAGIGRGLAAASTGLGTFIAYSTQPGNVALDGDGRNSPFTAALTKHIAVKGRNLPSTMIEVRKDVVAATAGRQVPWDHSALTGDFYFVPGDVAPVQGTVSVATAGSSTDVTALQERLAKLEAEAKVREQATATRGSAAGPLSQADAMKIAELRARAASVEDLTKDLQKKLFAARQDEGKALDPNEKMKLQRKSTDIQMEWTRRGLDLKKLKDEIAVLEGGAKDAAGAKVVAVVPPPIPPVIPKTKSEKVSPSFEEADNVALTGEQIRAFKAPSPIACREACEAEASCAGYQHGKKAQNMGQCQLFSEVKARAEDQTWRSGVRTVFPRIPPSRTVQGFVFYDGLSALDGDSIKDARVDSADGCIVVCRNTPGCNVAVHRQLSPPAPGQKSTDLTQFCAVYSGVQAFIQAPGSTMIVRTHEPE